MTTILTDFWLSFFAGLFAPIGAVCVLPLYPGFLSFLVGRFSSNKGQQKIIMAGWIVTFGVVTSMFLFGLIFTAILQTSLSGVIGVISPIAFIILFLISLAMIFNLNPGRFFPHIKFPLTKRPLLSAFIFGFFFGFIVLPCNPAPLIVLFALSTSTAKFIAHLGNFVLFGLGMALPLLVFAYISKIASRLIIPFLARHQRLINLIAGLIMIGVSVYYLVFVFEIFT